MNLIAIIRVCGFINDPNLTLLFLSFLTNFQNFSSTVLNFILDSVLNNFKQFAEKFSAPTLNF